MKTLDNVGVCAAADVLTLRYTLNGQDGVLGKGV